MVTLRLSEYLKKNGYEVIVYTPDLNSAKLESHEYMPETAIMPDSSSCDTENNIAYLAQQIKDRRIDLLIIVWNTFLKFRNLRDNCPECRFMYIDHMQPFCESIAKDERLKRRRTTPKGFLKWIAFDWIKFGMLGTHYSKWRKRTRILHDNTDAFVVLTPEYRREMIEALRISDPHIHIIGNGVPLPTEVNTNKSKSVLWAGRLTYPDKRVDRLLRIWKRVEESCPEWNLTIAGDGEERQNLERQATELGLKHITFAGYQSDMPRLYSEAAILCLTSTVDSWGLCLAEAQANGVVPIAFDCSAGVRHILSDDSGILIKPFDEKAYAEALIALIDDETRRKELQQNAIRKSLDYNPEKIHRQWLDLFRSLLSGK